MVQRACTSQNKDSFVLSFFLKKKWSTPSNFRIIYLKQEISYRCKCAVVLKNGIHSIKKFITPTGCSSRRYKIWPHKDNILYYVYVLLYTCQILRHKIHLTTYLGWDFIIYFVNIQSASLYGVKISKKNTSITKSEPWKEIRDIKIIGSSQHTWYRGSMFGVWRLQQTHIGAYLNRLGMERHYINKLVLLIAKQVDQLVTANHHSSFFYFFLFFNDFPAGHRVPSDPERSRF